jgi:hypothetical protein
MQHAPIQQPGQVYQGHLPPGSQTPQGPAYATAPASAGYPGVAMPAGYPPPKGPAGAADPRTMYQFSGAAAPAGDKRTFVGSLDSLQDLGSVDRHERSTNLKTGASSWVLIVVGLIVVGGGLAFLSFSGGDTAPEPVVSQPAPAPAPAAPPAPVAPAVAPAGALAEAGTPPGGQAAAPPPAPVEAPVATPPEPAPEPAPAPTPAPKKTTTTKPKPKPKPAPEPAPAPEPKKIAPKKPPRADGLNDLPKPP